MTGSYKDIVWSSSIIGGSKLLSLVVSVVRTKVAALILGPTGIGLIGVYGNLIAVASTIGGVGVGNVGTRQVAQAVGTEDPVRIARARRALFWASVVLSLIACFAFWLARELIATYVVRRPELATEIGWLSVAIGLTIASASQSALLRGLRRISEIAKVSVLSAVASSAMAIAALALWGRQGLIVYLLAAPLATFLLSHWYVAALRKTSRVGEASFKELWNEWRVLLQLGFAVMTAALAGVFGVLLVRLVIGSRMGLDELGIFQASWAVSSQYLGVVLGAMGMDFFPRLSAALGDDSAINRLINEQTEVALLVAAPLIVLLIGLAPWVIKIMYTDEFLASANLLRWQVLGDAIKLSSWPLGIALIVAGGGRALVLTEWMAAAIFAGGTWMLLSHLGLMATSISYILMYCGHVLIVYLLARRRTKFRWSRTVRLQLISVFSLGLCLCAFATYFPFPGAIASALSATVLTYLAIRQLHQKQALPSRLNKALCRAPWVKK